MIINLECFKHNIVVFSIFLNRLVCYQNVLGFLIVVPLFCSSLFYSSSSLSSSSSSQSFIIGAEAQPIWHLDGTQNSYLQFASWSHFFSKNDKLSLQQQQQQQLQSSSLSSSNVVDQINKISQASIGFEFRCQLDHSTLSRPFGGLLFYSDDESGVGGIFVEIKLISDLNLRVRIDDNSLARIKNIIEFRQQINFTDGQWHRIELTRHLEAPPNHTQQDFMLTNYDERIELITLKVDSEIIQRKIFLSSTVPQYVLQNECRHKNKAVFIGGLPEDYRDQYLAHLALPTTAYELHFRGAVRNVHYSMVNVIADVDDKNYRFPVNSQTPLASQGLLPDDALTSKDDLECDEQQNRCEHGAYCYAIKNGVVCDCSATDYQGTYCQNAKQLLETTFHGNLGEYLGYNFLDLPNAWSMISTSESFEISFKTKKANGLLLLTSDEYEDYLAITIRDAGLTLTMKMGSAIHEKTIKPSKVRFDDNQWHTIMVWRKIREISHTTYFCHFSITVDGIYTQYGSTASTISYLISKVFYVGGVAHNSAVETSTNSKMTNSNFAGCLRRIIIKADNIRFDLLEMINSNEKDFKSVETFKNFFEPYYPGLIRFYSNLPSNQTSSSMMVCKEIDVSDPITFTTSESYLKLNYLNSSQDGSLSLKLRTNEPNGVVLYADGVSPSKNTTHSYFAIELLDGHLYVLLNYGSLPIKVKATAKRIDDSFWHTITVRRSGLSGQVIVDDTVSDFVSPGHHQSNRLELNKFLYLGGLPHFTNHNMPSAPPELWSASLGYGFIGCVRDFFLNDRIIDVASYAKRQDSGSVKPSCHSMSSQCVMATCQNGGICNEGWNRYTCDCTQTAYTGSVCAKNAATISFNGEQYLKISLPEDTSETQAESLSLRFRTKKPNGLLMAIGHIHSLKHYMVLSLFDGAIHVDLSYGDERMDSVVVTGSKLNNDKWHTVQLERKGPSLEISVDNARKRQIELIGKHFTLKMSFIQIGARINLNHHHHEKKHYIGFVGYMQNFVFNKQAIFEKARDGQWSSGSLRMTAKLGKKDRVLHNAVTFKSKYTFVGLPQLKAYSRLNIYFQFKTREPNGLIFFNGGGPRQDFIAIELANGNLNYIFDLGDGPRRLQSSSNRSTLNDNRWHTVTLGRPMLHQHTMLIDDSLMTINTNSGNERNLHLDLNGLLYFGGVRDDMWPLLPKAIKSRHGFEGCIASVDLNGETFNLVGKDILIPSTLVESGCSAPITRCSSTACANRGVCVQLWNSFTCDCDLTTFSGPTCADGNESTAYQIGPNPGLISFTFDEDNRPDTRSDLLALGFLTTQKNGALVRVDSATTADYLQLELIDGNVLAVYNLGTEDIDIGDLGIKINDGKYHIVRFTRSGQNSTLQIDNHNVITRSPVGKQLNIFNHHARIQIGGHKNVIRNTIEKSFIGIIAGLVFNGHRLLDMAAEDDPRIKIEGDVELMISIGNQQTGMMTTPSDDRLNSQMLSEPKSTYSGDDLIYSNAGSGCFDANEDEECAHIANEGSGDDLITPVYVAVNRFRPTTVPPYNRGDNNGGRQRPCQNEDDDDCVEGSGDDRPMTSYNYTNYNNYYSSTFRPPSAVGPIDRPPFSNVPPGDNQPNYPYYYNTPPPFYYGNNDPYGTAAYPIRPKTTAPSWTKPVYSISGPTRPILHSPVESQGPPEIYDVPLNIPNITDNETFSQDYPYEEVLTQASHDRTVIIIGGIATFLIAIVVIGPIIIYYKVRWNAAQSAYKIETFGSKMSATMPLPQGGAGGYASFNPVVRAMSVSEMGPTRAGMRPGVGGGGVGINSLGRSMSRPGTRPATPTDFDASTRKRDPHEWYV